MPISLFRARQGTRSEIARSLVGEDVKRDNAEDGAGKDGCGGDDQERCVSPDGAEGVGGFLAELSVVAPGTERCDGAEDEGGEGEDHEEELEADDLAGGEPVDDEARGLRGLVGSGLNIAKEERQHEERGGEDEQKFECGE